MATTIESVRRFTLELATALAGTHPDAAEALDTAASVSSEPQEDLLAMRSALVSTRAVWETLADAGLAAEARSTLGAAKRLAIEL